MKTANFYKGVVIILGLVFLGGCIEAAMYLPEAIRAGASVMGSMEDASVNVAVSPGTTRERLNQIKKVAFVFSDTPTPGMPFMPGGLTDIMADNLSLEMMKLGFESIERQRLKKVLEEQGLQMSGAVDADNAVKAGKIIGVQAIITGSVQSSQKISTGYMGIGGMQTTSLIQGATLKIIGVEQANTLMIVAINYKNGQKPDVAARSMAAIIKAKLEEPFGKEARK